MLPGRRHFFPLQQWVYQTGSTTICLAPNDLTDTEYCIDFDSNLGANGQQLKIWRDTRAWPLSNCTSPRTTISLLRMDPDSAPMYNRIR